MTEAVSSQSERGMVELTRELAPGRLVNDDLAPSGVEARTWNLWHIASLWVGMSVCIPTYMLAASMIEAGMTWWQSLLAILIGNVVVLVPLVVNARCSTNLPLPSESRIYYEPTG